MKRFVLLVLILITGLTVFSQGIEFQKERYAEVLEMAKKQNKLVFIDIYTSWCGPCRKENPHLVEIYKKYKDKDLLIGVDLVSIWRIMYSRKLKSANIITLIS